MEKKESTKTGRPGEFQFSGSDERYQQRLNELNVKPTIDTFRSTFTVLWRFSSGYSPNYNFTVNQCSADLIDLGNGSWICSGPCSGVMASGKQFSTNWSIEFDNATKCILWNVSNATQQFCNLFDPNADVQMKVDIHGNPVLIIVRGQHLPFGTNKLYIETGSFLSIK